METSVFLSFSIPPLHSANPNHTYIQQYEVVPMRDPSSRISCIFSLLQELYSHLEEKYSSSHAKTTPLSGLLSPFTYHLLDIISKNHTSNLFLPMFPWPKKQTKWIQLKNKTKPPQKSNKIKPHLILPSHQTKIISLLFIAVLQRTIYLLPSL